MLKPFDAHCCHMDTAVKHPVPDRVKPGLSVRVPGCQKLQMTGLTRSGTGCFTAVSIWQQWASKASYAPTRRVACMLRAPHATKE